MKDKQNELQQIKDIDQLTNVISQAIKGELKNNNIKFVNYNEKGLSFRYKDYEVTIEIKAK